MCDRARRFTRSVVVLVVLAVVTLMATPVAAQSTTGVILGRITDPQGLALPGATVTATNTETGQARTVVTDSEGTYFIGALQVGLYRIDVTISGFRSFQQEAFALSAAQNARVDAQLAVGGVTEAIDVVGNRPRVDTRSSAVVTTVNLQRMQELPMLNRSVLSMAVLSPGITEVTVPDAVTNQRTSAGEVVSAAMGGRTNQNDIQLDGATLTTTLYNRPSNLPSPDSIQEFQVLTNSYSAEFGRGGGTSMLAITKSGTNTLRGGAWEYHRNDALNGMTIFATSKPYMNRNQFGANLGGPIRRNQTFFFFNYEGLRFNQEEILLFNPPTAAMRAGDFSRDRFGNPQTAIIYDPVTQQPFPGNQIPASRFDPLALKVLSYVPLPNQPGGVYNKLIKRSTTGDQVTVKVDHKLSQANTVSVRWYRDYASSPVAVSATNIEEFYTRIGNEVNTWTMSDTHLFANGMVGEGRASFSRIITEGDLNPAAAISPRAFGFGLDMSETGYIEKLPTVSVTGNGGAFNFNATESPWFEGARMRSANYRLSWLTGRHSVKVGYEYLWRRSRTLRQQASTGGNFVHNGASTLRRSDGNGGLGMADFLLGRPSTFSQATQFNKSEYVATNSFFAQDDIRVKRLTVNLGVRLDIEPPWKEDFDRGGTYVPGQKSTRYPQAPVGLVYPGDEGIRPGFVPTSYKVLPRTGFALDLRGDGRTALRGGYGMFGSSEPAIGTSISQEVPPFHPSINLADPFSLADPWGPNRTSVFPYTRNDQGEGLFPANPFSLEIRDLEWQPGDVHQFNLTFQHQLGDQIVVTAGYVGSRGRNLTQVRNLNLAAFIPGASTTQNVDARRPNRSFTNIIQSYRGSWSDYDSLQVTAQKQYANNYTLQVVYTLGRTYDDGNIGEHATSVQDPRNPRLDHAISSRDRTHVLRLNGMYELPRLENKPAVVRLAAGGWRLAGIMSYLSGTPVNVTSGVDRALIGCGGCAAQRPNLNGDPTLPGDRSRDEKIAQWFNTNSVSLWTLPDLGQFGNAPRNPFRGPSTFSTDMSLAKILRLSSLNNRRLELRIEAFNVFDNAILNNPNGVMNNANFGRIIEARAPRVMQVSARFDF